MVLPAQVIVPPVTFSYIPNAVVVRFVLPFKQLSLDLNHINVKHPSRFTIEL